MLTIDRVLSANTAADFDAVLQEATTETLALYRVHEVSAPLLRRASTRANIVVSDAVRLRKIDDTDARVIRDRIASAYVRADRAHGFRA